MLGFGIYHSPAPEEKWFFREMTDYRSGAERISWE
jgi:hypothetical protein